MYQLPFYLLSLLKLKSKWQIIFSFEQKKQKDITRRRKKKKHVERGQHAPVVNKRVGKKAKAPISGYKLTTDSKQLSQSYAATKQHAHTLRLRLSLFLSTL